MIPAGAQRFLPPAIWRELTGADLPAGTAAAQPRRGVLLNAQERLRSVLFLLSTYLPAHLVQQKMRRPTAGQVDGRLLSGAFLFSDVSGFTALSEQLAVHADGAERLTTLINAYMTTMLDVLSRSGGVLIKFAGDALLAYFPMEEAAARAGMRGLSRVDPSTEMAAAQAAARAGRAALRMMEAMDRLVGEAAPEAGGAGALRMKIGIGTGDCLAAAVGDRERMEYFLLGGAVTRMMAAESHASAGQVVGDAATARGVLESAHLFDGQVAQGMCWQVAAVEDEMDYYTIQLSYQGQEAEAPSGTGPSGTGGEGGRALLRSQRQGGRPGGLGDFEVPVQSRRARSTLSWAASHHAVVAQIEVIVRQIEALVPFLAPELIDRIVAGAARRRVESEYRPAVVMFVSITGPEQLLPAAGTGPVEAASAVREATRLLDGYFRAVHRIIADHGGVVARVDPYGAGTKMLILFGAPVAHEDDAVRAVGAALAMNDALAVLNQRWQRQGRARRAARSRLEARGDGSETTIQEGLEGRMRHRIGITHGLTFAGQAGSNTRREYTVMGDDVNLAARLMGAAQWGQILVGKRVRDEVANRFVFAALAPIHVKGKRDAVEIFEAQAQAATVAGATVAGAATPGALFVGRAFELAMGQRMFEAVVAGQGSVLAIGGAAGVGKTRLAMALAAHAEEQGARTLAVECRAYAAPPYAPWCTLLHDLLDVPPPERYSGPPERYSGPPDPVRDNGVVRQRRLLAALDSLGVDEALTAARHAPALATLMGIPMTDRAVVGKAASRQQVTGPTLFARLEKQVENSERALDDGKDLAGANGAVPSLDVWQLARARRAAANGRATARGAADGGSDERMWHRLQERVVSRQQARLGEALAEVVRCASTVQPLLLVIDHAQWLDDASRALLDLLLERLAGARVLMVVVGRLDDAAWFDLISSRSEAAGPSVVVIKLDPLDAATTARFVQRWLGAETAREHPEASNGDLRGTGVDEALVATLYRHTGGNPLFLEEMMRAMVRHPGHGRNRLAYADVTDSLQDGRENLAAGAEYFSGLVLSRVDALPPGPRDTVRVASVVGDLFRQSEVDVLLESSGSRVLNKATGRSIAAHDMLSALVAGELLSRGKNGDDPIYTFRQALVREVIYRSHSFARRRALHALLAAHLVSLPGTEVALLAHHYELAGQPQAAARCLLESARGARARYAYGRAIADCERALAALAEMSGEEKTPAVVALQEALYVEQGDAYLLTDDLEAAVTVYGEAVALYEAPAAARGGPGKGANDPGSATIPTRLSWRLALALAGCGREADALARLDQAWFTLEGLPGEPHQSSTCLAIDRLALAATLAWLLHRSGDRQVADWIERMHALGGEAEREWQRNGLSRPAVGSTTQITRLLRFVEEVAAGGDDQETLPLIFAAVNEVYEAQEDRHEPGSFAEGVTV
ncbi:MAG: AAA family ATPase [Anaerolineae bacterium]|nr:AAA family ATPase [Anaerolineae bacterium]